MNSANFPNGSYARRLHEAIEQDPKHPNYLAVEWLSECLHERYGPTVAEAIIASVMSGQTTPAREVSDGLAEILQVDSEWLFNGT